jgi:hypothetical protein
MQEEGILDSVFSLLRVSFCASYLLIYFSLRHSFRLRRFLEDFCSRLLLVIPLFFTLRLVVRELPRQLDPVVDYELYSIAVDVDRQHSLLSRSLICAST